MQLPLAVVTRCTYSTVRATNNLRQDLFNILIS
jgi:hypothetical protein